MPHLPGWLAGGRYLTLLLDRLVRVRNTALLTAPLRYDGGGLVVAAESMTFVSTDNLRSDLRLTFDPSNRVILRSGRSAFVMGPRTGSVASSGRPEVAFTAEPGDELSFTAGQSLLPWRAPPESQIFGGPSPRWKRYVYYRLVWQKPTGARLAMLWRYEQQYFTARGWTRPLMMFNSQTGLLSTDIQPESRGSEGVAVQYLARTKGWQRGDYDIEPRPAPDPETDVFAAIHLSDACAPAPGAGRSVELSVDRAKQQVTRELGGQ